MTVPAIDLLPNTESPCVRICMIDPGHDFCVGCWRTLQEISDWHRYTPAQKQALLARLEDRRAAHYIN